MPTLLSWRYRPIRRSVRQLGEGAGAAIGGAGLIVGRTLLYPPDDDVSSAVAAAVRWCADHAQQALHPGAERDSAIHRRPSLPSRPGGASPVPGGGTHRGSGILADHRRYEVMILPLAAVGWSPAIGRFELSPRASGVDGPADMAYVGIDQTYSLSGDGPVRHLRRQSQAVLPNRGSRQPTSSSSCGAQGNCSPAGPQLRHCRSVRGRLADRVRGHHPRRQWSTTPLIKHDENTPTHSELERSTTSKSCGPDNSRRFRATPGVRHTRPPDRGSREVRTGDVVLVPHGLPRFRRSLRPATILYYLK